MARAVELTLSYGVEARQFAFVENVLGLTVASADSGETVVLEREPMMLEFEVPAALYATLAVGDKLYIDTGEVTGHDLNDAAYTKTASSNLYFGYVVALLGSNKIALAYETIGN
jgi:predicted RecA/RadA family phage recombinase